MVGDYLGFTVRLASVEDLITAASFGRRIQVSPPLEAYLYKGDIWVNDDAWAAMKTLPEQN